MVDDDPAARLCLSHAPGGAGEVERVAGGRPFGLVCMGIHMPRLSAPKGLRAREAAWGLPPGAEAKVVMISSCDDTRNVCDAFFGGMADGYVKKPLRIGEFSDERRRMGLAFA